MLLLVPTFFLVFSICALYDNVRSSVTSTSRPWESDISDCRSCYHHPPRACTMNIQWWYLLTAHTSTWPLLLITWCPFWKLLYILVTSRHSDGRPQDVLCSRPFNHPKQIPPQAVDAAESSDLWHRSIWRHNETMGHTSLPYFACGRLTQSVQHVVVDSVIHKAPDGVAGVHRLDAATRTWLK